MLKYALMAVAGAVVVALVFVLLPINRGPRPDPRILTTPDAQSSTSFTIRDAPPPQAVPSTPAPPAAASGDLDAVMQRLRGAAANPAPDTTAAAQTPASAAPASVPPAPASPVPAPAATDPVATAPPPPRFPTVTGQGTRWRMARTGSGYTISIDLGGGQVADVHVLPAFANLDPAAINVRVDYLRDTIVQNFSRQSGSYSFARDGSVSLER